MSAPRRPRPSRAAVVLGVLAAALFALAAVLALRGHGGTGSRRGSAEAGAGTVYLETGVAQRGRNSVLALRYRDGSLRPLQITEYPTGGAAAFDLSDSGVLDADQQLAVNAAGTLLFAVNQGSDTVAVFHIAPDGTLSPVAGSPFPSGGKAPASVGVSGDVLVVANKAVDGVRDLRDVEPSYTTFRIGSDGALTPTGYTMRETPRASPTQVYVAPGGRLVFTTEESGVLRVLDLAPNGRLTEAAGSPYGLPNSLFPPGGRPSPVWPAGLSSEPGAGVLYSGIPNNNSIVAYDYDAAGRLSLQSETADPAASLPCWSVVSADGHWLYFANAGSDNVSVFALRPDPRRPQLHQTVALRGGGNPWGLRLDPTGRFLYVITPRQVGTDPPGSGQLLHVLRIATDGSVSETADSPVPLPVAVDTNPVGLAVVPDRG